MCAGNSPCERQDQKQEHAITETIKAISQLEQSLLHSARSSIQQANVTKRRVIWCGSVRNIPSLCVEPTLYRSALPGEH